MTDNPILCPYCGAEMTAKTLECGTQWLAWYQCGNAIRCTADSPMVIAHSRELALKNATAAARKRYVPSAKPRGRKKRWALNLRPLPKEAEGDVD